MKKQIAGFGLLGVVAIAALIAATGVSCLNPTLKELNPCLVSGVVDAVNVDKVDAVDLLFVIDKSQSMIQEQQKVRGEFKRLIQVLTSGDKDPTDNGGVPEEKKNFTPAKSLHLAVASSDLGLPAIASGDNIDTKGCVGLGDDGRFLAVPHPTIEGLGGEPLACAGSYPPFLNFNIGDNVEATATGFQCVAGVGPMGCGFEQQLEAGLKALWPTTRYKAQEEAFDEFGSGKVKAPVVFLGQSGTIVGGNGDSPNHLGFLRGTPYFAPQYGEEQGKMSLLAVVVVSDENDCSVGAKGNMDLLVATNSARLPAFLKTVPGKAAKVNLRCFYDNELPEGDRYRYPVERYIAGFKSLRGLGSEKLTVFGAIVGVPVDAIKDNLDFDGNGDVTTDERNAYFQSILSHQMMQEVEDPTSGAGKGGYLQKACVLNNPNYNAAAAEGTPEAAQYETDAEPGVRYVQVAAAFGQNGVIRSICEQTFTKAMDQIIDAVSKQLGGVCLKRTLNPDVNGVVNCSVTWDMPLGQGCTADYLVPLDPSEGPSTRDGRAVCKVKQIPVTNAAAGAGDDPFPALNLAAVPQGWYYDNFSLSIKKDCKTDRQRIAFLLSKYDGPSSRPVQDPPAGVTVNLVCLNEMNALLTSSGVGKKIGDPCPDGDCQSPNLICHPQSRLCVQKCSSTRDCPPAWVCDSRAQTVQGTPTSLGTGTAICVNPTCGT